MTRRAWLCVPAVALTLALAVAAGAAAPAHTLGVVVACAGEELAEVEALSADALVAALVARDLRAAFLHADSPLLRARGVRLPAVGARDDWTPLGPILGRIASRLQLDYLTLIAVPPGGADESPPRIMLVARDGRAQPRSLPPLHADGDARPGAFAALAAEQVLALIDELGEPRETEDEPVIAPGAATAVPVEPAAPGSARVQDAPPMAVPDQPAAPPTVPAEETEAAPEATADPLAPARQAYERGDYEGALLLLREPAQALEGDAGLHLLRAKVLLALQSRAEAMVALERALALDPARVEARVWLGRLQAEQGLWQGAIEQYELALAAEPANREALLGLARLYRDHGHRRKAIALLTEAVEAGETDPTVLVVLAELHENEGELEVAQRLLVQAASLSTGERTAEILERLGDLYAQRRLHREALSCYQRAAEISPSRSSMVQRRYLEVMAAADNSVGDALSAGWSAFRDYVDNRVGEREMVFRALSQVRAQVEEALQFADSVSPPDALVAEHARRQYAYSLTLEALVAALTYLDLGEAEMRTRADLRHQDALAEFGALRGDLGR